MGESFCAVNRFSNRSLLPVLSPAPWKISDFSGSRLIVKIFPAGRGSRRRITEISMRDRSKNRKPLQRGRNLSIEAIQTVQALKRGSKLDDHHQSLQRVLDSKFKRLLKLDMVAVLRELIRQNECLLALKVFEDVRKEYWYKPQLRLYADMISVLASNGLFDEATLLFRNLKLEPKLEPDIEGFNILLTTLVTSDLTVNLAMECFNLMKQLGCEPDRASFTILINALESKGETIFSAILREEARKCFVDFSEFPEDKQQITVS